MIQPFSGGVFSSSSSSFSNSSVLLDPGFPGAGFLPFGSLASAAASSASFANSSVISFSLIIYFRISASFSSSDFWYFSAFCLILQISNLAIL